ncbi:beta-carotene 3-hydroxylase [Ekhidna lutea]|uniref:Beta-carotene 3-hydroxylase n=1 Tax=Ekhidna lutea TaxID=447679 RepID=A0A239KNT6_EKHLU|nr:sterol desaturase family protein [Ekhidna lutea]SNT20016.1 beta-carotene 3-hydroxylase [Ekhidna lutea]
MTIINILIVIGTFLFMEGVAWFTHKYIMHGLLWSWHRSHHKVHDHAFEMNDLFAIVFSIPSILTIYIGYNNYQEFWWLLFVGIGIFCYGVFYFIFHDIIVHRRIKIPFKAKNKYMKRIMHAHYIHHEKHSKEGAEAFGFLYAPKKYQK